MLKLERVDWPKVVRDLQAAGLSQSDQANRIGVTRSSVSMWALGVEPRYSAGAALLALHRKMARQR